MWRIAQPCCSGGDYSRGTLGAPDEVSATAWHRDVATDRNSIWRSLVNVTYWLSVRCVKDR